MKIRQNQTIILILSFSIGLLFFAIYNKWIIFTIPTQISQQEYAHAINKKNITLHYFNKNRWNTEKQVLLWKNSTAENLNHLVQAWLVILDEEKITPRKINLESTLISNAGVAYISFDHTLFSKEYSIHKKWMLIESLLKTVAESDLSLHSVQLLVHHQQLHDYHLDFSKPWPIHGFIMKK